MSTNRPKESPPSSTNPTPGVWVVDRPGRPNPFGVQWRERVWDPDKKIEVEEKRTEFFSSASERDKRRAKVFANKQSGRANDLSREEVEEWRAFLAAAGGVPWRTILAGYHSWLHHSGAKSSGITVETYRVRYLADCEARTKRNPPEMSTDNYRHRKKAINDFAASFGHFELDKVASDKVEAWLDSLGYTSNFTFNSQRKHLNAFFNDAVAKEVIDDNPLATLKKRRAFVDNRKRLLTPSQTAQLFHHALTHDEFRPCLARLALEAFVGIRFSSAQRLAEDQINIGGRGVLLPADRLKTGLESGQGHYIEGAPAQVWAWIKVTPASGWDLTERQYLHLKSLLFRVAHVPHPKNCLRKSFFAYDLNAHRNPGRTAYLGGHRDQRKLWDTYKGNATHADSVLYQAITPQTCETIAQGGWPRGLDRPRKARAPRGGSASASDPAQIS